MIGDEGDLRGMAGEKRITRGLESPTRNFPKVREKKREETTIEEESGAGVLRGGLLASTFQSGGAQDLEKQKGRRLKNAPKGGARGAKRGHTDKSPPSTGAMVWSNKERER